MRLRKFEIGSYRVLQGLKLDFTRERQSEDPEEQYALDFLAGVNGTGKSTVLHLLGRLFAWLEKKHWFPVPVELEYELADGPRIRISNLPQDPENTFDDPHFQYWIGDKGPLSNRKLEEQYLPRYIVMYTTGEENEWQSLLATEEAEPQIAATALKRGDLETMYLQELPGHAPAAISPEIDRENEPEIEKRLLFIQEDRLPAVALCGLLASRTQIEGDKESLHYALESVGIERLAGFSLRCRVHKGLILPTQQEIIEALSKRADRIVRQGADRLLLFDLKQHHGQDDLPDQSDASIFGLYESPLQLFQAINALYEHRPYQDPPLQQVNLFFERTPRDGEPDRPMLHLWDWLSDGERCFLARMALFTLFREDDILILIDEPEVHFNDVWKREIVNMLYQIMSSCHSHALLTTHSSITLTDVREDDILVLTRDGAYVESSRPPGMQTFGADPSDIMVHVFGTRHASGEHSVRFIREKIGRANTADELQALKQSIAPGYWSYRVQLEIEQLTGVAA